MKKIFCVCCTFFLALSLTACGLDFKGNRIGNDSEFTLDYTMFNSTDTQDLVAEAGDTINAKIVSEKGSLKIKIQKDDEEPIYEGDGISIPGEFDVGVDESGNYTVTVTGKRAKGRVSFTVESEQIQATKESQVNSESTTQQSASTEMQNEECIENTETIPMLILDEINQDVQIGTTGAYMTAVQAAAKMLDWGTGTGLDPQEIKDATISWMMNKGNDEQVSFAEKLEKVDNAYHKLLGADAQELLESAGCTDTSYPWGDTPVEAIEAVMDAVGLRPYEEMNTEMDAWKIAFEESLLENYQVTVDHYEDLGDGVYQAYVVIDGKMVPYVTVDSKTGDYHG